MSYVSQNVICLVCRHTTNILVKRGTPLEALCSCGEAMIKSLNTNATVVSYPDGSTNRFAAAKEKRDLDRAIRKAKLKGDKDSVSLMEKEKKHVLESSKTDRQVINICSKSED